MNYLYYNNMLKFKCSLHIVIIFRRQCVFIRYISFANKHNCFRGQTVTLLVCHRGLVCDSRPVQIFVWLGNLIYILSFGVICGCLCPWHRRYRVPQCGATLTVLRYFRFLFTCYSTPESYQGSRCCVSQNTGYQWRGHPG